MPLKKENWIICGNALRLDWLGVCPPTGIGVKLQADDLFGTPLDQAEIDFENEGGETYICGNPPYLGSTWQLASHKEDLRTIFERHTETWKSLDYVSAWFMKAAEYGTHATAVSAFVATNSVCQGQQVGFLWPLIFETGHEIAFAHTSFKWSNLASHKAGVTVVIVGISNHAPRVRRLYSISDEGEPIAKDTSNINAYLVPAQNIVVQKAMRPLTERSVMDFGNKADDGGHLTLTPGNLDDMKLDRTVRVRFIKQFCGSKEFINGETRYCVWVDDDDLPDAQKEPALARQIELVRIARLSSKDAYARSLAARPHQFKSPRLARSWVIVTPRVSSENRPYLPVGLMSNEAVIGDRNFALYDAPLWNLALIASRLHWVWIATVCVRMRTDFSYSNTLGWNTFPVPILTEKNKTDLTRCAHDILLAREAHFPATIADLYDPECMPDNLRHAHDRNDEVLERIYIGRRFKNDTERLEKLFDMYIKMTDSPVPARKRQAKKRT
ncbi:MAG: hypothetical protein JO097_03550 [Acidobacteriaceae bacterium]|nr:hypothetical protein [Acidobacteriaceae bacterium]MBV9296911.1 hypothetical protein [Acidobacteriaceae bacterium]